MKISSLRFGLFGVLVLAATPLLAATVKITPLGSHTAEFCKFDRAMLFEDPDGTRVLYDAGRTVTGPDDPRLGNIDVLLVSHMHGDHVGDKHQSAVDAGECGNPDFSVKDAPNTNVVNIALAKKALIITGSEMPQFFAGKLKALGGDPKKSQLVRFGASRKVGGVTFTTVPAVHSNGVNGAFIEGDLGKQLQAAGLTAYAGPPTGYVLRFSNGLVVYLSGDTGITAEQDLVVRQHYQAKLAVMNIGDIFTTGPKEAAYVINTMVRPNAVIPSHANEVATRGARSSPAAERRSSSKPARCRCTCPSAGRPWSSISRAVAPPAADPQAVGAPTLAGVIACARPGA